MRHLLLLALPFFAAQPAFGRVVSTTEQSFVIEQRLDSDRSAAELFRAFLQLPRWWSSAHSYSGDAGNLSLDVRAGGCWCERLPGGGGVEHMRVAYVDHASHQISLTGSLGPLLEEATTGVMVVSVARQIKGSTLLLRYRVSGFARGGAPKLAAAVDAVLAQQIERLGSYAAAAKPER